MAFENSPVAYNGNWPELFKSIAAEILEVCGQAILSIEHIGSTSVAGLSAKPIIDILIEVKPQKLSLLTGPLIRLGYQSKGDYGIPGRSYFNRPRSQGSLGAHIHAFETGSSNITKHIAFRDYLRAHPAVAKEYNDLKARILSAFAINGSSYQESKAPFIDRINSEAIQWYGLHSDKFRNVRKAVIYGLRKKHDRLEVLVFDQIKYPEVNPQVPSGTIEKSEHVIAGAKRELFEESGITPSSDLKLLGSYVFYKDHLKQFQERFIFAFSGQDLPDTWIHTVTGGGVDQNLEFKYYWKSVSSAQKELQVNLGDGLEFFKDKLESIL